MKKNTMLLVSSASLILAACGASIFTWKYDLSARHLSKILPDGRVLNLAFPASGAALSIINAQGQLVSQANVDIPSFDVSHIVVGSDNDQVTWLHPASGTIIRAQTQGLNAYQSDQVDGISGMSLDSASAATLPSGGGVAIRLYSAYESGSTRRIYSAQLLRIDQNGVVITSTVLEKVRNARVIETQENEIVIAYGENSSYDANALLFLDSQLNVVNRFTLPTYISQIVADKQGHYWYYTTYPQQLKIVDPTGTELPAPTLSTCGYPALHFTEQSELYVVSSSGTSAADYRLCVDHRDAEGNQLWYKEYAKNKAPAAFSVAEFTDGGVAVRYHLSEVIENVGYENFCTMRDNVTEVNIDYLDAAGEFQKNVKFDKYTLRSGYTTIPYWPCNQYRFTGVASLSEMQALAPGQVLVVANRVGDDTPSDFTGLIDFNKQ